MGEKGSITAAEPCRLFVLILQGAGKSDAAAQKNACTFREKMQRFPGKAAGEFATPPAAYT